MIDPVLSFSTYLDSLSDTISAVATDAAGDTYITGITFNTTYPVTSGVFQPACTSCANNAPAVFITKLNATGTAQIYSTFLGGSSYNQPSGLAVDSNGDAIVTGYTESTDFPLKNPISAGTPSYMDGFVTSLSPDGSSLNFSSRLGGSSSQGISASTFPGGVAVDASGNVFVAGTTESSYLPVTPGALNAGTPSYSSGNFVFLTKFQQSGSLVYSALLGNTGSASDCCSVSGVAVDSAGDEYVAGTVGVTDSTSQTPWPITAGAYQSTMIAPGDTAPFAAKVSADGSTLLYSTLVTTGVASGMALKSDNELILVGSPNYNYPVTSNAYSSTVNSSFIATLSADGSQLLYSSYFGGSETSGTSTDAVTLDSQGNIWLAGYTRDSTFPLVTPLSGQFPVSSFDQGVTSFLSEFNPSATTLKFSTFIGDLSGSGLYIALDSAGKVHAAGTTTAPIYTTAGAFIGTVTAPPESVQYTYPYAVVIDPSVAGSTLCLTGSASTGLGFGYQIPQTTMSQSVHVTNCGGAPLVIHSIASSNTAFNVPSGSNGCTGSIAAGSSCTVSVQFTPTAVQAYAGQLTFTSNASIATVAIPLNGSGGAPSAGFGPPGSTQTLIFPAELVGQTSPAEFIGLYNNGTVPLTIYPSQIAVTSGFALASGGNCTSSLPPGQSCLISIKFAATKAGTFNGTLSVKTNDPINPTISTSLTGTAFASYPVPTITALNNPSYPINSGTAPITMSVSGTNFFPASVVYINGVAQTTTYGNDTLLSVTFSPSLLNAVGQIPVTVLNPTPGGGTSASYPLIGYLSIPLTASALTADPVGGFLYAAIPASASQNPNTIIPINPATGAMLTPIPVANGPRNVAVSDDGSELYVASTGVLQRINLHTLAIEKTFNLPVDPEWGQTFVEEMHVVPGSPQSIVVELFANVDPDEDGLALYNDSGLVNWLPGVGANGTSSKPLELGSFTFTSSSMIYGLPQPELGTYFLEVPVSPSGLSYTAMSAGESNNHVPLSSIVRSDGTLLYTNSGEVWNPSTMTLLGTYVEPGGAQIFYAPSVIPDKANGHTYFLDENASYSQYQAVNIDVYDQTSYAELGTVPFTNIYSPDVTDLVRWGSNGFAFRCVDITGNEPAANQIVIVTSNLVINPNAAPVPILSSVSPVQVTAGGAAYTMQLTGSGFTSASTVSVNGNPLQTTYVSGTSLTAQVPASDITTAGQLNVQVTTPPPGGGTSNAVTVSIEGSKQTTPVVTVTPSATSITTAQALNITVGISGGSGNPTPTGSVTLSGSGYTSASTTVSGGSVTITIPSGALATGTDTLTATYTPDSASSATYNSATGKTSVTVTALGKNASTITATPASAIITNEQADAVAITVTGVSGQPTPTGTVTLTSESYSTQQTLANGAASITIPAGSLSGGADTLTATYSGDGTYAGSSGTAAVTVSPVVVAATVPSGVSPGGSTTSNVTFSAGSNYSGTMKMSCTLASSPSGAQSLPTCSLNPTTVNIAAAGTGSTTLTVQTTAVSNTALLEPRRMKLFGLGGGTILAGVLLVGVPARRRRWMGMIVLLWGVVAASAVGCGGGGGTNSGSGGSTTPATTAGTYAFQITGTDSSNSSITAATTVVVTVQ